MISDNVRVSESGDVTGDIYYLSGMSTYQEEEQQSGHYFPTQFDPKLYDTELHVGGKPAETGFTAGSDFTPTQDDPYLIIRVENCTDESKVTVYKKTTKDELFTLNFDNANLEKVSIVSAEESVGYNKTGGDLMRNVSITWDGTTGTVKGTAKHITGWEQLPSDPHDGHFIAVKLDKTLMGKRFSFTKGTDWEGGEESTSDSAGEDEMLWVLRLDKNNKFTFKSNGEIVARLDCSGVTLEGGD